MVNGTSLHMHDRGHAWQGACMVGGHAWQGEHTWCGDAWWGACVAGKTTIAAGGTHPTGTHSCFCCILFCLKLHVDMARRKELRNEWYRVSDWMMTALRDAAIKSSELTEKQRMKWRISTTHDEVCACMSVFICLAVSVSVCNKL